MSSLPWLVVHGAIVWKAALAAAILAAAALARARPRRAARREAAAARARLGAPLARVAELRDGERVVIAGRLAIEGEGEGEGEGEARIEDGASAEHLSLVIGEVRVDVAGPVEILAGSREVRRGQGVVWRSLATGDHVRMAGVLRREGAQEGKDYRAPAVRWSLVPGEDAGAIQAAFEGAPRVSGPAVALYTSGVTRGATTFFLLLMAIGELAYQAEARALRESPPALDRARTAMTIAAMTPLRRASALEAMLAAEARLRSRAPSELPLDCDGGFDHALSEGRLADAEVIGDRCLRPDFVARARYLKGDFGGASAAIALAASDASKSGANERVVPPELDWQRFRVRAHLLAGRFAIAAEEARRLGAMIAALPVAVATAEAVAPPGPTFPKALCLAEALAARGGDPSALARLQKMGRSRTQACTVLLADLLSGAERVAVIRAHGQKPYDFGVFAAWFEALWDEADPESARGPLSPWELHSIILGEQGLVHETLPGVSHRLAETLAQSAPGRGDPRRRALSHAAARAAGFAIIAGNYDDARRKARLAVDNAGAQDTAATWGVAAAVEIFAGDLARGAEYRALAGEPAREGGPFTPQSDMAATLLDLHDLGTGKERSWWRMRVALAADGSNLVYLLQNGLDRGLALRVAARARVSGRAEVLDWLRAGPPEYAEWSPGSQVGYWITLSEIAFNLGDAQLAAELRARARPFTTALLRRDIAVPLAVLEQPWW